MRKTTMLTEPVVRQLALRTLVNAYYQSMLVNGNADLERARSGVYMTILDLPETAAESIDSVEMMKAYAKQQARVYKETVAETGLELNDWMDVFLAYENYYAYMHPAKNGPTRVSDWIVEDGYCALRALEGSDPEDVNNRIAFIEKTPRIRTKWTSDAINHQSNWSEGPKGAGGNIEDDGETIYGFYPPSRAWCDAELTKSGFIVPNITSFTEEKGKVKWSDVFDYVFQVEED